MRMLIYVFNKTMRHMIRGLFVETESITKNVKEQIDQGYHVILMPIYRSWADFFLLSYA
jgi:glycerol-3-phosphate O-acyltransferase